MIDWSWSDESLSGEGTIEWRHGQREGYIAETLAARGRKQSVSGKSSSRNHSLSQIGFVGTRLLRRRQESLFIQI